MKAFLRYSHLLAALPLLFIIGCGDDDPAPTIDCKQTGPSLTIVSSNDVTSCDAADGSFSIATSGGTGTLAYTINGIADTDGSATNLSAGNYTVQVTDSNGCEGELTVTIADAVNSITIDAITATDAGCGTQEGTVTASASGSGNLMYTINGTTQSSATFTGLSAGVYDLLITDDSNCSVTQSVQVFHGTTYTGQIANILATNCILSGCHNGDNGSQRNWSVFSNVQTNASNIKSRTQSGSMPPPSSGITLSQSDIDLISCWVDDGARDN